MNKTTPLKHATALSAALMTCTFLAIDHTGAFAQAPVTPPRAPQQQGRVSVVSPEVQPDRRVTFRLLAPKANEVLFASSDSQGVAMTKGENGVWEVTRGPLEPGPYRYSFSVDGVTVVDPRSPATSEANGSIRAWFMYPARTLWTPKMCRMERSRALLTIQQRSPGFAVCMSIHRRVTSRAAQTAFQCCICSMAPGTATIHGLQSVALGSSWTISLLRAKQSQ